MKPLHVCIFSFVLLSQPIVGANMDYESFTQANNSGLHLVAREYDWCDSVKNHGVEIEGELRKNGRKKIIDKFREDFGDIKIISEMREVVENTYNENGALVRTLAGYSVYYYDKLSTRTGPHLCAGYLLRSDGAILLRQAPQKSQ